MGEATKLVALLAVIGAAGAFVFFNPEMFVRKPRTHRIKVVLKKGGPPRNLRSVKAAAPAPAEPTPEPAAAPPVPGVQGPEGFVESIDDEEEEEQS